MAFLPRALAPACALAFGFTSTLLAAEAPATDPKPVRAAALLLQIVASVEESVTAGELGQVHNEDEFLYSVLAFLSQSGTPEQKSRLDVLIPALGRSVSELHQAADTFDREAARERLPAVKRAFDDVIAVYDKATVEAARSLAERFACPMHPEDIGKRDAACPKCGMPLDARVRVWLDAAEVPRTRPATVTAEIRTKEPLTPGAEAQATLKLKSFTGEALLLKNLREVHTKKIHLLIVDPSLTDYHHEHPEATDVPGEYAFRFTPRLKGPYRAFADVLPLFTGFQEYVKTEIPAPTASDTPLRPAFPRKGETGGLRFELSLESEVVKAGKPVGVQVMVTKEGKPFAALEPVMAAFAHLVGFHEGGDIVLHMHPIETKAITDADRGGPELHFRMFADTPGFYRLFLQTQVGGKQLFVPFGVNVVR